MIYAGDETLAHEQQHPEAYDGGDDPLALPCEECGARQRGRSAGPTAPEPPERGRPLGKTPRGRHQHGDR